MKSPVFLLLGLFVLVHGAPFMVEYLLFEPRVVAEPPPLVPVPELCKQLGLNTFVKLLNELNLTQLLETHPSGESYYHIFCFMFFEFMIFCRPRKY